VLPIFPRYMLRVWVGEFLSVHSTVIWKTRKEGEVRIGASSELLGTVDRVVQTDLASAYERNKIPSATAILERLRIQELTRRNIGTCWTWTGNSTDW
jgi:hypothetical protein